MAGTPEPHILPPDQLKFGLDETGLINGTLLAGIFCPARVVASTD